LIIFGLSISRKESRKICDFLNKEDGFNIGFESDLNKISWSDSQIIVMNRVKLLEKKIYNNTKKSNKKIKVVGDVGFYFLPYLELLINNFPHLKFVCTNKNKNKIFEDIFDEIKNDMNPLLRILFFRKKFKNHWIHHNGSKWEKDYILDKCYPKFDATSLKNSIDKYIDLYYSNLKKMQKKYPNNLKIFYSDELNSDYGKNKIFSFIGSKQL